MVNLTQDQIKEIADQLDCGFRCFLNCKTGELLFIPDTYRHPDMDTEAWSEEIEKFDSNPFEFKEFAQLESRDSFNIMAQFVDTLDESSKLKERLITALNNRKPFREFKFVIDNSGDYRKKWFDFKNQKLLEWVQDNLDIINQKRTE